MPVTVERLVSLVRAGFCGYSAVVQKVHFIRAGWAVACAVLLPGCMVGPDYTPPAADAPGTPDAWHVALVDGLEADAVSVSPWWQSFNDPTLDELVLLAEQRNLGLQTAATRIEISRARYGIASADLWPSLSGFGFAQWKKRSDNRPQINDIIPNSEYIAALDMSWEIDLWGRVQRSMESAEARVQESIEDWRDLLVTVRAEVAASYIAARTLQQELRMLRQGLELRARTLELTEQKYAAGTATELELAEAIAAFSDIESRIPGVETDLAKSINRLSVLIGEAPGPLRDRLAEPAPVPMPPTRIAIGIPADAVRQRPDIRAAERRIAANSAKIGEATANLLPRFTIQGAIGFEALSFDNWLNSDNLTGGIGPAVVWPLFTAGKILSDIEAADLRTRASVTMYERTVLTAFEEIENVLIGYVNAIATRESLRETVVAYERVVALSAQRYEAGVEDLDRLLEAQRLLLKAEEQSVKADGQVSTYVVSLYRALGGDWQLPPGPEPVEEKGQEPELAQAALEQSEP